MPAHSARARVRAHVALVAFAAAWLAIGLAARAEAACTISVGSGVAFGSYDVFSSSSVDSTGQFTWRCDVFSFPYVRITLTKGNSTTYSERQMRSPLDSMRYNLFLDSARTNIWGDESEGTSAYYQQYWGFGQYTVYVYGRVPYGQNISVGAYADNVTVVVNF